MFVAVCDHVLGASTSSWRKITCPLSFPINAVRRSHSTASNGDTRPSVNRRLNSRPVARRAACCVSTLPFIVIRAASAISASAPAVLPPKWLPGLACRGEQLLSYSLPTAFARLLLASIQSKIHDRVEPECWPRSENECSQQKKAKAQLSRARTLMRAAKWGQSPLDIGLTRSIYIVDPSSAQEGINRLTFFPPSLGAQYRRLWKTCQEKFAVEPQNILHVVPKASTHSGACAEEHNSIWAPSTNLEHSLSGITHSGHARGLSERHERLTHPAQL